MAANRRDYVITHHLRERFIQRTNKKYTHIGECREAHCKKCASLRAEIRGEIIYDHAKIDEEIYLRLDRADENRSYLNNTSFMEWYHEKYGFDNRFEFLIDEDLLFVVIYDEGKKIIVTCVSSKTHLAGKSHLSTKKFNKIKRKEDKVIEALKV
jgi:hypothetical protein